MITSIRDSVEGVILSYIKTEFDNPKRFKVVLHQFLYKNSFYSFD